MPQRAARVHAGGREVQRAPPIPLVDLVQRAEKGTAILRGIAQVQLGLLCRPVADVQQDVPSLAQLVCKKARASLAILAHRDPRALIHEKLLVHSPGCCLATSVYGHHPARFGSVDVALGECKRRGSSLVDRTFHCHLGGVRDGLGGG